MTDICDFEECKRYKYKGKDKCILHCEKSSYKADTKNGIISQFNDELSKYIIDNYYHKNPHTKKPESLNEFRDKDYKIITLDSLCFPYRIKMDQEADYLRALKQFKGIEFKSCEFMMSCLNLGKTPVFFQDCVFHETWTQGKFTILEHANSLHQKSTFKKDVFVSGYEEFLDCSAIKGRFFAGCTFNAQLVFSLVKIKQIFANDLINVGCNKIHFLSFHESIVESGISLDGSNIKDLKLLGCEFVDFHFYNQELDSFCINNCIFKGRFSVRASNFKAYKIRNSVFEGITEFDSCTFGKDNNDDDEGGFSYVTFNGFSDFRNTQFNHGLDLETLKAKEPPNFLNIKLLSNNTSRETLRIIKYSFDRIGNTIEANRFFALEMSKHCENLKSRKWYDSEKLLLNFNKNISNFGQSYYRPIGWLVGSMLVLCIIYYVDYNNLIFKNLNFAYPFLLAVNNALNVLAKSIMPFSKFLPENREFIGFVFYLVQASFIWQALVAIKRKTKR